MAARAGQIKACSAAAVDAVCSGFGPKLGENWSSNDSSLNFLGVRLLLPRLLPRSFSPLLLGTSLLELFKYSTYTKVSKDTFFPLYI